MNSKRFKNRTRLRGALKHLKGNASLISMLFIGIPAMGWIQIEGEHSRSIQRRNDSIPVRSSHLNEDLKIISDHIQSVNPGLTSQEVEQLSIMIFEESSRLIIPDSMIIDGRPVAPAHLVTSMIQVESSFKRYAVSSSDARGYMQVKPSTARWLDTVSGNHSTDERLFHGRTNIRAGIDYLNTLILEMPDIRKVTLSYNAGPNAVRRGVFHESYWIKILNNYRELQNREASISSISNKQMLAEVR